MDHFRGGLLSLSVSLLFFLSSELLKWQFPAQAAGQAVSMIVAALRSALLPAASRCRV
jgi:hypothetical protein